MFFRYRAWCSTSRQIYNKPYDSKTNYGSSSQMMCFYDKEIETGSVLCVYRNLKTNRIHFAVNDKEETVSIGNGVPAFCYGFVRLCSNGNESKIQVTLMTEEDKGNRSLYEVVKQGPRIRGR